MARHLQDMVNDSRNREALSKGELGQLGRMANTARPLSGELLDTMRSMGSLAKSLQSMKKGAEPGGRTAQVITSALAKYRTSSAAVEQAAKGVHEFYSWILEVESFAKLDAEEERRARARY